MYELLFPADFCTVAEHQLNNQLENSIPWKRGVFDVSIANPVLSQEEMIINIYSPFHSACGEKFIFRDGIAEIAFFLCSGSEGVEHHRSLLMKGYVSFYERRSPQNVLVVVRFKNCIGGAAIGIEEVGPLPNGGGANGGYDLWYGKQK
ncbi:hypothetical protein TNCV_992731 [Trichonephila clavipes]|nr:hypothetical protein TNCV_992731 [Trichonephila clavipes]